MKKSKGSLLQVMHPSINLQFQEIIGVQNV